MSGVKLKKSLLSYRALNERTKITVKQGDFLINLPNVHLIVPPLAEGDHELPY